MISNITRKDDYMSPIRHAGVIAFLDWIRRTHPGVRSLKSLSKDEFMSLATAFEDSKGLVINKSHRVYEKWAVTQGFFRDGASDTDALESLDRFWMNAQ